MKVDIVTYEAISGKPGKLKEVDRIPCRKLREARWKLQDLYESELENALFNVASHWISANKTEAHIFGYGRDEQTHIVLEEHHEHEFRKMAKSNPETMANRASGTFGSF